MGTIYAQKPINLVPTLCVGMPPRTLRVPANTQDLNLVHLVTRSVTGCIPTRSVGTIDAQNPVNLVPTLCVGMPPRTLRVPANTQDLNLVHLVTRSVTGCIPTRSVGTIDAQNPVNLVPTLCVGMPPRTLRVPANTQDLNLVHLVTRSVTGCIPTRSVGTIDAQNPVNLVPTLCVGMPPRTLRVPANTQDLNLVHLVTRSVTGCIPTRSVGTIDAQNPVNLVPTLCVGMPP
ncbi:hypothetical protein, partial [Pseudomonas sp.]|uniref:hypothetical protein n=1 Tax=Pseudomonas sp. TaxID=306 RepID=UPI0028B00A21